MKTSAAGEEEDPIRGAEDVLRKSLSDRSIGFRFRHRDERINWRVLMNFDVEKMVEDVDVEALQSVLENVTFGDLFSEESSITSDPAAMKLLQIAQYAIEYLCHAQDVLVTTKDELEHVLESVLDWAKTERKVVEDLRRERSTMESKMRKMGRLLKGYEEEALRMAQAESGGAPQTFKCPFCQKIFRTKHYLASHVMRRHPEQSAFIHTLKDKPEDAPMVVKQPEESLEMKRERDRHLSEEIVREVKLTIESEVLRMQREQENARSRLEEKLTLEREKIEELLRRESAIEEEHKQQRTRWEQQLLRFQESLRTELLEGTGKILEESMRERSRDIIGALEDDDGPLERIRKEREQDVEKTHTMIESELKELQSSFDQKLSTIVSEMRMEEQERANQIALHSKEEEMLIQERIRKEIREEEKKRALDLVKQFEKKLLKQEHMYQERLKQVEDRHRLLVERENALEEEELKRKQSFESMKKETQREQELQKKMVEERRRKKKEQEEEEEKQRQRLEIERSRPKPGKHSTKEYTPDSPFLVSKYPHDADEGTRVRDGVMADFHRELAKYGLPQQSSVVSKPVIERAESQYEKKEASERRKNESFDEILEETRQSIEDIFRKNYHDSDAKPSASVQDGSTKEKSKPSKWGVAFKRAALSRKEPAPGKEGRKDKDVDEGKGKGKGDVPRRLDVDGIEEDEDEEFLHEKKGKSGSRGMKKGSEKEEEKEEKEEEQNGSDWYLSDDDEEEGEELGEKVDSAEILHRDLIEELRAAIDGEKKEKEKEKEKETKPTERKEKKEKKREETVNGKGGKKRDVSEGTPSAPPPQSIVEPFSRSHQDRVSLIDSFDVSTDDEEEETMEFEVDESVDETDKDGRKDEKRVSAERVQVTRPEDASRKTTWVDDIVEEIDAEDDEDEDDDDQALGAVKDASVIGEETPDVDFIEDALGNVDRPSSSSSSPRDDDQKMREKERREKSETASDDYAPVSATPPPTTTTTMLQSFSFSDDDEEDDIDAVSL